MSWNRHTHPCPEDGTLVVFFFPPQAIPIFIAATCCGSVWIKRPHQWPEGRTSKYVWGWVTVDGSSSYPLPGRNGHKKEEMGKELCQWRSQGQEDYTEEWFSTLLSSNELELHYHFWGKYPQLHLMSFSFPLSFILVRHFLVKVSHYNNVASFF